MTTVDHAFADIDHQRLIKMHQPETAKSIYVYLNGDSHFTGRKLVVNRRHVSDFDGFLNQVTLSLKAPFGAVRNIYTPKSGHRVNELTELNTGMKVVAGGVERFRKIDYTEIGSRKRNPAPRRNYLDIKLSSNRMPVSARWRKYVKHPCEIFVYGNGDIHAPALRLLLIPKIMRDWELILNEITEKICLRTGVAVRKLYDLNFRLLSDPSHLVNGQHYIAVGTERLKRFPYGDLHSKSPSQRKVHQPLPPIKRKPKPPPREDGDRTYTKMYAQKKKQKEEFEETTVMGASAATGYKPLKVRKYKTPKQSSDETDEEPVFPPPKPVKVKRLSGASVSVKHDVPPTSDENDGVFKRGTYEIKAETVDDDENTKVDLPIDQVAPVEVEEESFPDKKTDTTVVEEVITHRSDEVAEERQKTPIDDSRGEEMEVAEASNLLIEEVTSNGNLTDRSEGDKPVEVEEALKSPEESRPSSRDNVDRPEEHDKESNAEDVTSLLPEEIAQLTTRNEEDPDIEGEEKSVVNDNADTRPGSERAPSNQSAKDAPESEPGNEASNLADLNQVDFAPGIEHLPDDSRPKTVVGAADDDKNADKSGLAERTDENKSEADVTESHDDAVVKEEDGKKEDKKDEVVETPISDPGNEPPPSNRSVTPSSPRPREEANTPAPELPTEADAPDALSTDADGRNSPESNVEKQNEQSPSPLPQTQESLEIPEQNGEIPARPASDALTVDDDVTAPLTPSSKKSVANGNIANSNEVS